MKRLLGPLLLVVLVVGVGAAIYFSATQQLASRQVVTVTGLIGSEKESFFADERVQKALAAPQPYEGDSPFGIHASEIFGETPAICRASFGLGLTRR